MSCYFLGKQQQDVLNRDNVVSHNENGQQGPRRNFELLTCLSNREYTNSKGIQSFQFELSTCLSYREYTKSK